MKPDIFSFNLVSVSVIFPLECRTYTISFCGYRFFSPPSFSHRRGFISFSETENNEDNQNTGIRPNGFQRLSAFYWYLFPAERRKQMPACVIYWYFRLIYFLYDIGEDSLDRKMLKNENYADSPLLSLSLPLSFSLSSSFSRWLVSSSYHKSKMGRVQAALQSIFTEFVALSICPML